MSQKHSIEYVKDFFLNIGYKLISEYIDSRTNLGILDVNGYKYWISLDAFCVARKKGFYPQKFASRNPFTIDNIRLYLIKISSPFILISEIFTSAIERNLIFYCVFCKKEWYTSWNDISNNRCCPNCNKSAGEVSVSKFLEKNNFDYVYQYKFDDCKYKQQLPFDFFIPDFNFCIEFNGIQHYKPIDFKNEGKELAYKKYLELLNRDAIKKKYCIDNNINLVTIPYWDIDNVDYILSKEFLKI